jgi:hypothetical protein
MIAIISLAIGIGIGVITSLIFRSAPQLRVNPITQTFLLLAFSITSYYFAEIVYVAGV